MISNFFWFLFFKICWKFKKCSGFQNTCPCFKNVCCFKFLFEIWKKCSCFSKFLHKLNKNHGSIFSAYHKMFLVRDFEKVQKFQNMFGVLKFFCVSNKCSKFQILFLFLKNVFGSQILCVQKLFEFSKFCLCFKKCILKIFWI